MYFDLRFCYRLEPEVKAAQDDKTGEYGCAYVETVLDRCKNEITKEKYDRMQESQRIAISKQFDVDEKYVVSISGEEYEENVDVD
jgi:hypothetical protein